MEIICELPAVCKLIEPVLVTPFNAIGEGAVQPTLHFIRKYFQIFWPWINDVGFQINNRSARQWPEPGLAGTYRLQAATFWRHSAAPVFIENRHRISECPPKLLPFCTDSYQVLPVQSGDKS
jgi:hypothetical protein